MMLPRFSASSLPNRGRQRTTTFTASRLMVAVVVGVGEAAQANADYAKSSRHGKSLLRQQQQHHQQSQLKLHAVGCGRPLSMCVEGLCVSNVWVGGGTRQALSTKGSWEVMFCWQRPNCRLSFVVEAGARRDQSHQGLLSLVVVHSSTLG